LSIALLMIDLPQKLLEGVHELFVAHVVDGVPSTATGTYTYIYIENEEAQFDKIRTVTPPTTPVCDRTSSTGKYRCAIAWPERTISASEQRARLRGIMYSFLESACTFPKTIAERLMQYGASVEQCDWPWLRLTYLTGSQCFADKRTACCCAHQRYHTTARVKRSRRSTEARVSRYAMRDSTQRVIAREQHW
jgi:hypothetical protein